MSSKRIMDIELLRAVAVMGVLFHHVQGMPFPGGWPRLAALSDSFQLWGMGLRELWFRFAPLGSPDVASDPWLALVCALVLIGLLSELNYRMVEIPMRNRGAQLVERLRAARPVLPASGAPSC